VDSLLKQAGYQPDSSARNALSMMNFDASPPPLPLPVQEQRQPLTEEQIYKLLTDTFSDNALQPDDMLLIRATEAAHGITAPQPAQEPVGQVGAIGSDGFVGHIYDDRKVKTGDKLYTTPAKREWVGLTDEEIDAIYWQHENHCGEYKVSIWPYERSIEAKLKEKNT
jgi:hypothetical protein